MEAIAVLLVLFIGWKVFKIIKNISGGISVLTSKDISGSVKVIFVIGIVLLVLIKSAM